LIDYLLYVIYKKTSKNPSSFKEFIKNKKALQQTVKGLEIVRLPYWTASEFLEEI